MSVSARDIPRWPNSEFGHLRKRKAKKFEGSSRFWRGRIVAVLRETHRPVPIPVLQRMLSMYGEVPEEFAALLATLVRDGVIRSVTAGYRLA